MDYSVLMTVYKKEKPEYLKSAIESMLNQTVPPAQFVLVCDGPLNPELDDAIESYGDRLDVLRLPENHGPGYARSEGFKRCRCSLIATMDSDDLSVPDRCEKQLAAFEKDEKLAVVSGSIEEFDSSPDEPFAKRELPQEHEDILRFSKTRIPFNNVTTMYKKGAILNAGGYNRELRLFEDYDLWIRVLRSGVKTTNLPDTLVKVRTTQGQLKRRGGIVYGKAMLRFRKNMCRSGWISRKEYVLSAYPHFAVCLMPNFVRKLVYKFLRK